MSILEKIWFIIALFIVGLIFLLDPKSSMQGSSGNAVLSGFSSPSSGQRSLYTFSAILIAAFFILSVIISCQT